MVARSRSSVQRLRARSSVTCFAAYAALAVTFWIAGALAYWQGADGAARVLGIFYLPSLALPLVGRGRLAGVPVESVIWWWWFVAQAIVASLAICLYPYDRAPRTMPPRGTMPTRRPVSVS
jgi:hypothetical protein